MPWKECCRMAGRHLAKRNRTLADGRRVADGLDQTRCNRRSRNLGARHP
jgi:hypothetical protein